MIIAVNTRLMLKDKLEGIGWFMHENLKRITRDHPEHTFVFIFDRPFSGEFIYGKNVRPVVVPPPARHPFLWHVWLEYSVPRVIRRHKAELYLGPDGYMPLHLDIPAHITVHDINFHHRPMDLPYFTRNYYRRYYPRFARQSGRIATVSEYSKSDIVKSYGIDADKIDVVYNGANSVYQPVTGEDAGKYRDSLTGGTPYFVFVGAMHPRKNLANLLLAFDLFRKRSLGEFKLVIVGEKMYMTGKMEKAYSSMEFRKDVIHTGRLSPERLHQVLAGSEGLTFVPFFEGFGIPLLEAMKCGIPILASNVTSLPEIASDAAIYADPLDVEEIAGGMMKLSTDKDLRNKLAVAGLKRAGNFSWEKTSDLLWASVSNLIDQC
jgi:glycosyltransferase involved in cell wall biosynthesis